MDMSADRRAFAAWLRTGRLPAGHAPDGLELKFNPWHDPFNGRFTFAPGGPAGSRPGYARGAPIGESVPTPAANQARPPSRPAPPYGGGGNARAFYRAMTLEQVFPGLNNAPGGAILAVADNLLDLTGPATGMTIDILQDHVRTLQSEIKAIDPNWHYDRVQPTDALGNPTYSVEGLSNALNELHFHRATAMARIRGDYRPLQVETLRFVQQSADRAYIQGVRRLEDNKLKLRLSEQEALGNHIDRQVRIALRERYNRLRFDWAGNGRVRVNRREMINSASEGSYRIPDARVDDIAFDVTLTQKTLRTPQVRGFFAIDFRPARVVIIRPRQLGASHTYIITRPEEKR